MIGWIKIHRQLLEWEWYSDANCFRLFMHLLLKANHKEKSYRGMVLKAGSIMTGRDILAQETGLSVRQIRTVLDKLKTTNELTIKTSSKGTVIQIVNYEKYQLATSEKSEERPQSSQSSDQQSTTNKNDNNNKEDDDVEVPTSPTLIGIKKASEILELSNTSFALYATRQTLKTVDQLEALRNEFITSQKALGKLTWQSEQDCKNHFIGWVKKQPKQTNPLIYSPQLYS